MIESKKKQRYIEHYLIMGLVAGYGGHWVAKSIQEAPSSGELADPLRLSQIRWFLEHPFHHHLIDPVPTDLSVFVGILFFFLVLMLYFRSSEDRLYRFKEEHGSARFATVEELKKFRDAEESNDMIFSQNARMGIFNKRLPYNVQVNKNTATIGLPGDWKTRSVGKPNLLQTNSSFVVTDPKGLLVHEVGHSLKEAGYRIKVFDLVTLQNTCKFMSFII